MTTPHSCDEHCVCPDHGTPMWWGASQSLHACQRPDCRFARGWENHPDYEPRPGYLLLARTPSTHDFARLELDVEARARIDIVRALVVDRAAVTRLLHGEWTEQHDDLGEGTQAATPKINPRVAQRYPRRAL